VKHVAADGAIVDVLRETPRWARVGLLVVALFSAGLLLVALVTRIGG
jgi:hypothetical protein